MTKILAYSRGFVIKATLFCIFTSPKYFMTFSSKKPSVLCFYATVSLETLFVDIVDLSKNGQISLSRSFENHWNRNVNFREIIKIKLIK